jgi:hypothetical protein
MSIPVGPSQSDVPAPRQGNWYDPALRVGDAERGDVADRLSKHYSNGRLDHAEFSERLDRAMSARTMADLAGLLADLPENEPVPVQMTGSKRHQRRVLRLQLEHQRLQLRQQRHEQRRAEHQQRVRSLRWLPLFAAIMIAAIILIHTLTHSITAWLLLGLIAFLWLRHNSSGHHGSS